MKPEPILSNQFSDDVVSHGFFTRVGGVSKGIYEGLNVGLGSDDDRSQILENRKRVAEALGANDMGLVTPYQVHSADVLLVDERWDNDARPEVDGLVCTTPDIAIGVLTADCGPVLFEDALNGVIGACHAGWKGATGGVLENTIVAMEVVGAERDQIKAVLGPTISVKNYEVGPEFVERLMDMDGENKVWLKPSEKKQHAMFDLPGYIINRLKSEEVSASWTGHCTYDDEAQFFSYRRKTHCGEADYGRQVAAIKLNPEAK